MKNQMFFWSNTELNDLKRVKETGPLFSNYSELEKENVLSFIKNNGISQINSIFKLMNIKKLEDIK